jgi:hypothetical protein
LNGNIFIAGAMAGASNRTFLYSNNNGISCNINGTDSTLSLFTYCFKVLSKFPNPSKQFTGELQISKQIQKGTATTQSNGTLTITFSPAFISTPIITLSVLNDPKYIYITSSSNTSFAVYSATISGNTAISANFNWIAIAY